VFLEATNIKNGKERIIMTRKKRNAVVAGIVIIGLASVLLLIPILFNSANMTVTMGEDIGWEVAFQERLLEYAEFGLFYDEEISGFFYNEQRVRRFVDTPSLFQYDNGIVDVTVLRDSDGNIIGLNVQ